MIINDKLHYYEIKHQGITKKYIANLPENMIFKDVRFMNKNELLNIDYFSHDDELDNNFYK